jgi:hypothetical protein
MVEGGMNERLMLRASVSFSAVSLPSQKKGERKSWWHGFGKRRRW